MISLKMRMNRAFDGIQAEEALIEATQKRIKERRQKRSRKSPKKLVLSGIVLAAMVLFVFGSLRMYEKETAFIDIDVNPSIELKVNAFDRIVGTSAYNEEGKKILQNLKIENKKYTDAVEVLVKSMTTQGYLKENGLVSVTIQNSNKTKQKNQLGHLKKSVNTVMKQSKIEAEEEVFAVGHTTKHHSHEENVSPAKYLAIQELKKYDKQATMDECRHHSLSEIRNQTAQHHSKGNSGQHRYGTHENGGEGH